MLKPKPPGLRLRRQARSGSPCPPAARTLAGLRGASPVSCAPDCPARVLWISPCPKKLPSSGRERLRRDEAAQNVEQFGCGAKNPFPTQRSPGLFQAAGPGSGQSGPDKGHPHSLSSPGLPLTLADGVSGKFFQALVLQS